MDTPNHLIRDYSWTPGIHAGPSVSGSLSGCWFCSKRCLSVLHPSTTVDVVDQVPGVGQTGSPTEDTISRAPDPQGMVGIVGETGHTGKQWQSQDRNMDIEEDRSKSCMLCISRNVYYPLNEHACLGRTNGLRRFCATQGTNSNQLTKCMSHRSDS